MTGVLIRREKLGRRDTGTMPVTMGTETGVRHLEAKGRLDHPQPLRAADGPAMHSPSESSEGTNLWTL